MELFIVLGSLPGHLREQAPVLQQAHCLHQPPLHSLPQNIRKQKESVPLQGGAGAIQNHSLKVKEIP